MTSIHEPPGGARAVVILTHGAGANADTPLLRAVANELARLGCIAVRYTLPFRLARPSGPPRAGEAARDREGLRAQAEEARRRWDLPVCLGGHSYGGRQSSLLAAAEPDLAAGLLLLSYPLHPPGKPDQPRTAHFPDLKCPCTFAHGTRDAFGSIAEMEAALRLIPGRVRLAVVEGAGHDLKGGRDVTFCEGFVASLG
jgi:hypothetical protein